jgi:hypothetical protein
MLSQPTEIKIPDAMINSRALFVSVLNLRKYET